MPSSGCLPNMHHGSMVWAPTYLQAMVPEQVIAVPKIFLHRIPQRSACRRLRRAEQLVEVPTIVSYSSLQRNTEQNVDIPVLGRGGRASGLQGFLPGQGSTATRFPKNRISERIVEQIVDFPGGGVQDFRPGQSSSSSSHVPAGVHGSADGPGEGVFRTFSKIKKKSEVGSALGVGTAPRVEPIHEARLCRAHNSRGGCASVGGGFRG